MRRTFSITVPFLSLLVIIACGGGSSPPSNAGPDSGSVIPDGGHDATGEAATGACPAQAQVIGGGACTTTATACPSSTSSACPSGVQTGPFCACTGGSWVCGKTITACPDGGPGEAGPGDAADAQVPTGGACRDNPQCTPGDGCVTFVLPSSCGGTCTIGEGCALDSDCADAGANFVCSSFCHCAYGLGGADTGTGTQCIKGCSTAADCGPAEACSASHHCEELACTMDAQCGTNFSCVGGACTPKPCTQDSDCTGAYCVDTPDSVGLGPGANKACSTQLGVCTELGA